MSNLNTQFPLGYFYFTFSEFVEYVCAKVMNFKDPLTDFDFEMCEQWQEWDELKVQKAQLLAWRHSSKSWTLVQLKTVWDLIRDPTDTILLVSADSSLASRNCENVQKMIQNIPVAAHLIPNNKRTSWAKTGFDVRGKTAIGGDRSVLFKSALATATGFHSKRAYMDDIEVQKNVTNPENREKLQKFVTDLNSLCPWQRFVGTYWTTESIYIWNHNVRGFKQRIFPIYERIDGGVYTGKETEDEVILTCPERFPYSKIEDIRRDPSEGGIAWFKSQYLLVATSAWESNFDLELLGVYDAELQVKEKRIGAMSYDFDLYLGKRRIVQILAGFDTGSSKDGRDAAILAILLVDDQDNRYIHDMIKLPPATFERGFKDQARIILKACKKYYVSTLWIENNYAPHLGSVIKDVAEDMLSQDEVITVPAIEEYHETRNKTVRLGNIYSPIIDSGRLSIHDRVYDDDKGQWWIEAQEYPHNIKSPNYLDAGAIANDKAIRPTRHTDLPKNISPASLNNAQGYDLYPEEDSRDIF